MSAIFCLFVPSDVSFRLEYLTAYELEMEIWAALPVDLY